MLKCVLNEIVITIFANFESATMKELIMSKLSLLSLVYTILLVSTEAEVSASLSGESPTSGGVSIPGNAPKMISETLYESGNRLDASFSSAAESILDVSWKLSTGNSNVSERCALDTVAMYTSLRNLTLWAFESEYLLPFTIQHYCNAYITIKSYL